MITTIDELIRLVRQLEFADITNGHRKRLLEACNKVSLATSEGTDALSAALALPSSTGWKPPQTTATRTGWLRIENKFGWDSVNPHIFSVREEAEFERGGSTLISVVPVEYTVPTPLPLPPEVAK